MTYAAAVLRRHHAETLNRLSAVLTCRGKNDDAQLRRLAAKRISNGRPSQTPSRGSDMPLLPSRPPVPKAEGPMTLLAPPAASRLTPQHGQPASGPAEVSEARRWWQLILGIICMSMIANLQYGWTLFVNPIDDKHHWGLPAIQLAF